MRVYPAATTIRPRFGRKMLVSRSLHPETGFLEIKARRRADMKEPQTPLTTARSTVTARATTTRAQVGATTTRGEPSASATSPPAKSSCFRPSYGTPQPMPERQFPVTRRLRGAERYMGIIRRHVLTEEPGDRLGGAGIGTA